MRYIGKNILNHTLNVKNGNISGSATSTGSFGRVQAEHIHSTDDMTVADDLTVDGLIVASGDEIRGSYSLNKLTFPATQRAAINDVFFIHSSGGRGTLQLVGNTNRVGSNTLFGFSRDDINEFKSDHASVTYTNFMVEADAVIAFPGSSGPTQTQDLSIFKSNVTTTADHGYGKRLFLDFRRDNTAMFTADMSGSIYAFGNISGSSTSTGSFGHLKLGNVDTDASFEFGRAHVGYIGYSDMAGFSHVDNDGTTTFALAQSAAGKTIVNAKSGQPIAFKINNADVAQISSDGNFGVGIETAQHKLHVVGDGFFTGNVSGSAASTGSFGRVSTGKVRASELRLSKDTTEASDTTLSIENFGGGNKLTLSNGAVSLLFDGRSGQNTVGLNFNVNYSGMLGTAAATSTNPSIKFTGDTDTGLGRADSDQLSLITGGTEAFRVTSTLISGSAVSTGSFGRVFSTGVVSASAFIGDGSGITGLTSAAISSYTNSGNNRIVTSVDSGTVNSEANLTFDGSTLDVTGDIVVSGDLTINGTTTTLAATNLEIADAFGFFATGSAGANVDAGIIVQSGSYVDSGSAIYHDISSERWSVAKGVGSSEVSVSNTQWQGFVATVYTASASPVGSSAKYGVGEIHIDDDGEIYIYS